MVSLSGTAHNTQHNSLSHLVMASVWCSLNGSYNPTQSIHRFVVLRSVRRQRITTSCFEIAL